jgi:3'-phosphoadenosine 5'-phosphosulfate sulfotransferase (PAPS reductase)/FAD synthetase
MSTDHYRLTGPAQICFSGGRTSGYMLHEILKANAGLPADCVVSFQNTGKEREQTLAFIDECARRWHVPIHWIEWDGFIGGEGSKYKPNVRRVAFETASRNGEPFARLIDALGMLPNPIARTCSAFLKKETGAAYMRSLGFDEWDSVMGIRADEPRRVSRMSAAGRDNSHGVPLLPLARANVTKADVLTFWKEQPFDLQIDPQGDLGNCDLCFLKSRRKLVRAIQAEPARVDWWTEQENKFTDTKGKGAIFRVDRPRYFELHREAMFYAKQIPLDLDLDDALIDCMCGD